MRRAVLAFASVAVLAAPGGASAWWPSAAVDEPHPARGGFLDPRSGGLHRGIDVGVRDDQPEADAPPGYSHRVYAIEEGDVLDARPDLRCGPLRIGRFVYGHVMPTVAVGESVPAGAQIGWTCLDAVGGWHVHVTELDRPWGQPGARYLNPLRPGGPLEPFKDTVPPVIYGLRVLTATGAGTSGVLHGRVDPQIRVGDPVTTGWPAELAFLNVEHNVPYELAYTLTNGPGTVVRSLRRRFDVAPPIPFWFFYARKPVPLRNVPAQRCVESQPADCKRINWLHLWMRRTGYLFDTRNVPNGRYVLAVTARDTRGNETSASISVLVRN
jgi:hypothetical protein